MSSIVNDPLDVEDFSSESSETEEIPVPEEA